MTLWIIWGSNIRDLLGRSSYNVITSRIERDSQVSAPHFTDFTMCSASFNRQ